MSNPTRTDIHRPSAFQSADYRIVGYIDVREISNIYAEASRSAREASGEARNIIMENAAHEVRQVKARYKAWFGTEETPSTCRHCGTTRCAYFAVARHTSGENVAIGHQCSVKIGLPSDENQWLRLKKIAEAFATRERRDAALASIESTNPELYAALLLGKRYSENRINVTTEVASRFGIESDEGRSVVARSLNMLEDIASKARHYEYQFKSEAQKELLLSLARFEKAAQWAKEADARVAKWAAEKAALATLPALSGRITVTGKFLSSRREETQWGTVVKGLFACDTGHKIWMTCDETPMVPCTRKVTVTQSDKDPAFYFGSRPKAV